jgi:cytochrome c oxidase subunit I
VYEKVTDPTLLTPDGANGDVLRASIAYMVAGLGAFLLLGLLGLLMRLDHAGLVVVSPQWFYRVMTLHGSGMISSVLLAALGGLAASVSASSRLSARALWIALILYALGSGFVVLAVLAGGFAGGWTMLYPLPELGGVWTLEAALTMFVGYLFVALGLLVFCTHILFAMSKSHGGLTKVLAWRFLFSGGRDKRDPLPRPVELIAAVTGINGVATALAGLIYLVPLFARAAGLVGHVDVLFAKNFVYLFGHTLANLSIYMTAGLVFATLPVYTGRPWRTTWLIALAWNIIIIYLMMNWSHHLYADFAQPFALQLLAEIGSYADALPSFIVTIVGALALMYGSGMRWTVTTVLMALGLWGWVFGGFAAVLDSTIPVNQVMHNTMWVPAHFHTYFVLGAVAFAWAYLAHLVTVLGGKRDVRASRMAAWVYGLGGAGFVLMFFAEGANSIPRRYPVHLPQWQVYARIAVPFVLLMVLSLTWLTWDIMSRLGSAWRGTFGMPQSPDVSG